MSEFVKEKLRYMLLTINNPDEKDASLYQKENLIDYIKNKVRAKFFAFGKEIGEKETPHIHIYLMFENQRYNTAVSKLFNNAHVDKTFGTHEECVQYCHKSAPKFCLQPNGHYHYIDSAKKEHKGIHYTDFDYQSDDVIPQDQQGKRNDLTSLYDAIVDGKTNAQIYRENPNTMKYASYIDRIRQDIMYEKYQNVERDVKVILQVGTSGTGKTYWARHTFGNENIYKVKKDKKYPFDGYKGQDVILFEEFSSSFWDIDRMKEFMDIYPLELDARYADKMACYHTVIINSNTRLEHHYIDEQRHNKEDWNAFLRRINYLKVFEDGKVKVYKNDDVVFSNYFEKDIYYEDLTIDAYTSADGTKFDTFKFVGEYDIFADDTIPNYEIA